MSDINYLILKNQVKERGNQNYDNSVKVTLSMALGVSENKITKCNYWYFTKKSTIYNPTAYQQESEDMPVWHYLNYLKGFRDAEIWAIDSEITSDQFVIKYYKNLYGGIVNNANYSIIKEYVVGRVCINSLEKALGVIRNTLAIEKSEEKYLIDAINERITSINLNLGLLQHPLVKRGF